MLSAGDIIQKYISFFENRNHVKIPNSPLVPKDDPTTLFTSSGMQPLVPYLLGEPHPSGNRLVDVQNCFRAQDIDEIGDNRHTTFFRMLGNWSLGDYFKKEQIPWFWEFLTDKKDGLGLDKNKLYITIFEGNGIIEKDFESEEIWTEILVKEKLDPKVRIYRYGVEKNWWSRSGVPDKMPKGEPGGPDSEVFFDFGKERRLHEASPFKNQNCHPNCDCGRFFEIGNTVFMQYQKQPDGGFTELPKRNVDFGGGLERFLAAVENKSDIFETNLFSPIIQSIENTTGKSYTEFSRQMRIVADHLTASVFIIFSGVRPSNKEQGYIVRRLLRRGLDNFSELTGDDLSPVLETIVGQYRKTDPDLVGKFEEIKLVILEEEQVYRHALSNAKRYIDKELKLSGKKVGDDFMGLVEISADLAFKSSASLGLGPTQLKSLGYTFDEQAFAKKMEEHRRVSRKGAEKKFRGGLADHSEKTVKGHTATHLLHKALRDILGTSVHQTGSNITTERVRFDFSFDRKVTPEELQKVEAMVNEKAREDLPVHFEFMTKKDADKMGAIGLFEEKYGERVKIYFIGGSSSQSSLEPSHAAYSIEYCGGPHVEHTGQIKKFKILKEEGLGRGNRRIYAIVE